MSDPTVIRKSVTADDYATSPYNSPGLMFIYPSSYSGPSYAPLPPWWTLQRDFVLRGTVHRESMWADAVFKAITKIAALGWSIEDSEESQIRTNRGQDIFHTALAGMHRGWVPFISMHLQDYLLTDNGAFVEVIRASSAAGSRIMGIAHLDSARCTRTGDPDIPVLYRDRLGKWHEMRWWQVLTFADMPDPSDTWNGVGHCAASRAFLTLAKLAAMEQYVYEKTSGDGATEMTFIKGLNPQSLESAIITADGEQKRRGAAYYKGKIVVPILSDMPLEEVTIPLKNVPDGFDAKQERDNAYVIYANALGIPVQDIQPLSGQGLGTGTQTVILSEDAEGQGLAAWRKDWLHKQNDFILPTSTTFVWTNQHDTRDQKAQAEANQAKATVITTLVGNPTAPGVITNAQGLNLAVDWNVVPREFLPAEGDATPGGSQGDDEKPIDLSKILPAPVAPAPQPTPAQGAVTGAQSHVFYHPQQPSVKAHGFTVGDRVQVVGTPHMPGQKTGTIAIVEGNAYGIQFDGIDGIHKWYVADELAPVGAVKATKAETDALIDEQLDAALALVSRVLSKEAV